MNLGEKMHKQIKNFKKKKETIKKCLVILELKNKYNTELKNSIKNSKANLTEESAIRKTGFLTRTIQSEEQKEKKRMKKSEEKLWDLWDRMKRTVSAL